MADDINFLGVGSISEAKQKEATEKLQQQASNNVHRQQFAAAQRGETGGKPKAAPGPNPAALQKQRDDAQRERDNKENFVLRRKINDYFSRACFAPRLAHIPPLNPRASLEEVRAYYQLVTETLNGGKAKIAMQVAYLQVLAKLDPHLSKIPYDAFRIPEGNSGYCAMKIDALNEEFEMLDVEYGHLFSSGPLTRLFLKTMNHMHEYKTMVETGQQMEYREEPVGQDHGIVLPPPQPPRPDPVGQTKGTVTFDTDTLLAYDAQIRAEVTELSSSPACSSSGFCEFIETAEDVASKKEPGKPPSSSARSSRKKRGGAL